MLELCESAKECERIFEEALEKVRNGEILECFIVMKTIDEQMTFILMRKLEE